MIIFVVHVQAEGDVRSLFHWYTVYSASQSRQMLLINYQEDKIATVLPAVTLELGLTLGER